MPDAWQEFVKKWFIKDMPSGRSVIGLFFRIGSLYSSGICSTDRVLTDNT